MAEEKKYQTPWDCTPLGKRATEPQPTPPPAPPVEAAPQKSEQAKKEDLVIRMKVSDVPDSWSEGSPITVVGDRGEQLHAEMENMAPRPSSKPEDKPESEPSSFSLAWIVALLLGLPAAAVLGVWAWWRLTIQGTSDGQGGFPKWVSAQAAIAVEALGDAGGALWARCEPVLAAMMAILPQGDPAKWQSKALPTSPPSPARAQPQRALQVSPTQRPLIS